MNLGSPGGAVSLKATATGRRRRLRASGYLRMSEVAGRPGRVMLLQEAAARAGAGTAALLGRPTCMALPAALAQGVVASTGCIGNRVYTDLGEDDLYVLVPGKDLAGVADALQTIVEANTTLTEYHRGRRQARATE